MDLIDDNAKLGLIIRQLEDFYNQNPGFETDNVLMSRLVNIVHKELMRYFVRSKRYVVEIQEADCKKSVDEILRRKKKRALTAFF